MSVDSLGFIAALDIGTTTIKCQILNSFADIVGYAYSKVDLHYPQPGYVEIVPDKLLSTILDVIRRAVKNADINLHKIKSLGISTQRATFIHWRKDTGEHLHNFITWKDLRAAALIKEINSSWSTLALKWAALFLHMFTFNKKFKLGSKLEFASNHVSVRLLWALKYIPEVKEALKKNNLMFGTLETWLIYKLTGGQTYVTDISNASATGFFDPFDLDWGIVAKLLKIPTNILPKVVNNDYEFGYTQKEFFGMPIKIGCVMTDQSSSLFGSCCFKEDDLKVTIGTGAFLDVNTVKLYPSLNNMYPLITWRLKNELIFNLEVPCSDAGSLIEWMLNLGWISNPSETSEIAYQCKSNDGVYFIPAFSGLGPPINDEKAATGFIGIKPTTTKNHMVRAVLESIVYRIVLAFHHLQHERYREYKKICIDGGLSKNKFICQLIADITNIPVEKPVNTDVSVVGVAFLAGLNCGFWKDKNNLCSLRKIDCTFEPNNSTGFREKSKKELEKWIHAAERFKLWYN